MFRNAAMELENKTRTTKVAIQEETGRHNTRKFTGIVGGNTSIKMAVLGSIFQAGDNNSLIVEALEECVLSYA